MTMNKSKRRAFLLRALTASSVLLLSGCERLSRSEWFPKVLDSAEKLTQATQRLITPRKAMAQEFTQADLSPQFRSNLECIDPLPYVFGGRQCGNRNTGRVRFPAWHCRYWLTWTHEDASVQKM